MALSLVGTYIVVDKPRHEVRSGSPLQTTKKTKATFVVVGRDPWYGYAASLKHECE